MKKIDIDYCFSFRGVVRKLLTYFIIYLLSIYGTHVPVDMRTNFKRSNKRRRDRERKIPTRVKGKLIGWTHL